MSRRAKVWLFSILAAIVLFIILAVIMTNAESARISERYEQDRESSECREAMYRDIAKDGEVDEVTTLLECEDVE